MRRRWIALVLTGVIGCSRASSTATAPATTPATTATTMALSGSISSEGIDTTTAQPPPTCTAAAVESTIRGLFDAITAGDSQRADDLVTSAPRFGWFAIDPDLWSTASDRSSLRAFFVASAATGLTIKLTSIGFNGYRAEDQTGHFGFAASWGDRNRPILPSLGKGAIDCTNGKVMVFVLAARGSSG